MNKNINYNDTIKDLEVDGVTNVKIHILTFLKIVVIVDIVAIVNTRLDKLSIFNSINKNLNVVNSLLTLFDVI